MTDKQALRAYALRAGGGKWHYIRPSLHSNAYITDENGSTIINCTAGDVPANCVGFLESANPATVLALLDELESVNDTLFAAQKRVFELEARTLSVTLPDPSSKAFWGGSGKNETFYPVTYKRWVTESIERASVAAQIAVKVV